MIKKGKFQIFSYVINENLIFYKNLSKKKIFIAFSIFETINLNLIISALNKCLIKCYIKYYSVQLNTKENEKKIILNFEEVNKNDIIKIFNIVRENLDGTDKPIRFLKNNELEREFFLILSNTLNSSTKLIKNSTSFIIKNEKSSRHFTFYKINLEKLENPQSFLFIFFNLINKDNIKGYIIFNCKLSFNDNTKITCNFVELHKKSEHSTNLENRVNNFFNCIIIEKLRLKIKDILKYVWRLSLSENSYLSESLNSFFSDENDYEIQEFKKYSKLIEQNLKDRNINFIKLNKNLLLIHQQILFIIIPSLDSNLILKIIKNYYSKYYIIILILKETDYEKLIKIEQIRLLENIKILKPIHLENFDYNFFKENLLLKNA